MTTFDIHMSSQASAEQFRPLGKGHPLDLPSKSGIPFWEWRPGAAKRDLTFRKTLTRWPNEEIFRHCEACQPYFGR